MKITVLAALASLAFLAAPATPAFAQDEKPECRIAGIEQGLAAAETELKQSPAMGHAGGHYAKALKLVQDARKQIHEGCHAWMKSQK